MAEPDTGQPPEKFDDRINAVIAEMAALGHPVRIVSGKRTAEQQSSLFAKGRSKPGAVVTEKSGAPGDESKHQLDLARDFSFVNEGQSDKAPWKLLGDTAKKHGLEWGGDWTSLVDRPHVQMPNPPSQSREPREARGFTNPGSLKVTNAPQQAPTNVASAGIPTRAAPPATATPAPTPPPAPAVKDIEYDAAGNPITTAEAAPKSTDIRDIEYDASGKPIASSQDLKIEYDKDGKPIQTSVGYWENRGIAGKVWHPGSGAKERTRADTMMFDYPGTLSQYNKAVEPQSMAAASRTYYAPFPFLQDLLDPIKMLAAPEGPALGVIGAGKNRLANSLADTPLFSPRPNPIPEGPRPQPKLLGTRMPEVPSGASRTFAGGDTGQVVSAAQLEQNPALVTQLIKAEAPLAPTVSLDEAREADRLAALKFTGAEQQPGSRLTVPDRLPTLPLESGDTTGGFAPQTGAELPYPLNVAPNMVRPRAAQSEVLGTSGLRGVDLGVPVPPEGLPPTELTPYERWLTDSMGEPPRVAEPPVPPETPHVATGTGAPTEPLKPNRMEPISEVVEKHNVANTIAPEGDAPQLEKVNELIQPPENQAVPPAGAARGINAFAANGGSADQVLESRAMTKPIVDLVRDQGWDPYLEGIGSNIRKLGDITSGMGKAARQAFGRTIEGVGTVEDAQLLQKFPDLQKRLTDYRALMDDIFKGALVARGGKLGYIEDYLTHLQMQPDDFKSALQDIFTFRQGKEALKALFETEQISAAGTGEAGGIYRKGLGQVAESPFAKSRSTAVKELDYDVNKLGRIYIDSMMRETHLRPAVQKATELVKALPDSMMKELAEWYIRNVTRFDSSANLNRVYKKVVRFMIETTSRSMLGFNLHLQELHAMRLGPVYSELGTKWSAKALGAVAKNPAAAYREAAELGLMPAELYPLKFQTTSEKIASIGNFKSIVDFIDRSLAYNGFKAKYLAEGMEPQAAMRKAIIDTKRVTFMVDPARANRTLNPEYSNVIGRLGAQYKQVPAKIAEWVVRTGMEYKKNPAAAARMVALLATTQGIKAAGGPNLFHMPTSLTDWGAASMSELVKIFTFIGKGDIDKAMEETALLLTPGGLAARRQLRELNED